MFISERWDDRYKEWRAAVVKRDKGRCQYPGCRCRTKLQAHHIVPWAISPTSRYLVSNGIMLCRKHHKQVTGKEEHYIELFRMIVDKK